MQARWSWNEPCKIIIRELNKGLQVRAGYFSIRVTLAITILHPSAPCTSDPPMCFSAQGAKLPLHFQPSRAWPAPRTRRSFSTCRPPCAAGCETNVPFDPSTSPACSRRRRHASQPACQIGNACLAGPVLHLAGPVTAGLVGLAAHPGVSVRLLCNSCPIARTRFQGKSQGSECARLACSLGAQSVQIAYSNRTSSGGLNPDETA
jgi:hypothetical protein